MLDGCSTKPDTPKTYGLLFELMTGPETGRHLILEPVLSMSKPLNLVPNIRE